MRRHEASRWAWLRRRLWLWPDRNPLRRPYDRIEAWISAGLVAVFVIGGPLAAFAAGDCAYDSGMRAAARQAALPLARSEVDCEAAEAAVLTVIALALVLTVAWVVIRHLLDRRRLAAWDAGWRAAGPSWSHHR